MKVYEILNFNRELLKKIHAAGIKLDDYKYIELYKDYAKAVDRGEKVTYIVASLASQYGISERQVYNLVGKFSQEVNNCKNFAVE